VSLRFSDAERHDRPCHMNAMTPNCVAMLGTYEVKQSPSPILETLAQSLKREVSQLATEQR
jgi:hypothetical protein